jgi:inosose dehydratase
VRIRIANAPVSWGIMEVEGWSPPFPPAQFLEELKGAGYEGTELGPYGYLPTDPRVLGVELTRRSLTLTSAFVPLRLKDPACDIEPARKVAALLQALGADYLVLADALWPEREAVAGRVLESGVGFSERDWQTAAANIGKVSALAALYGLRCVFHHHAGSYIETPEECARLLELTDLGLCLDTGHYAYGGGDPVEAVESLGRRIEYLHFKDLHPTRLAEACERRFGFLDGVRHGVFCPLGEGMVRFPALLEALRAIDYDGWAVVEQDVDATNPSALPPVEHARASRRYLRSMLGV